MRTSWFVPVASALAAAFGVAALALPAPEAVSTAQPSPSGVRGIEWYKHSRWTADDGSPTEVTSVIQDGAGFLWLAGAEGLFRFDGLRFDRLEPAAAQAATGARPVSLAVARSGDVLVGYDHSGGVAMVVQGRLVDTAMPNPPPMITALVGDYQGGQLAFWGSAVGERAWQYRRGRWTAVSGRWGLPLGAVSLPYVTRDGALLLGIFNPDDRRTSIGVIRPGGRLEIVEAPGEVPSFAEDGRGRLWISDKVGIRRLLVADRSVRLGPLVHEAVAGLRYAPVAFERDGSMWGAAVGVGAFRIGDPGGGRPLERADQSGGLTSDLTTSILIDREGSVWIGTQAGLDKFQKAAMAHETMVPRQSFGGFLGTAQSDDGTRFFVVDSALYGVRPGSSSAVRIPVPPKDWQRFCPAQGGSIWLAYTDRAFRLDRGERSAIPVPGPRQAIIDCAEDGLGRLWLAGQQHLRWHDARGWHQLPLARWGAGSAIDLAKTSEGGVLVNLEGGKFAYIAGDRIKAFSAEGAGIGYVNRVSSSRSGGYVSGSLGLAKVEAGVVRVVTAHLHPWAAEVRDVADAEDGRTWILTTRAAYVLATRDLDRALADPSAQVPFRKFDQADGVSPSVQHFGIRGPQWALSRDGRVWVLSRTGLLRIDPGRVPRNGVKPSVVITSVQAQGQGSTTLQSGSLTLGPGVRNLSISYAAPSLAMPQRNRFRYMLEGFDGMWVDPGMRRQAFYTNLDPGRYRFRVIASNNDGVWNTEGASLAIVVPPTFLETNLFKLLCIAGIAAVLWAAYKIRLQILSARLKARWDERSDERERIARELHDTLLQSFQGTILRLGGVLKSDDVGLDSKRRMKTALDSAEDAVISARDRIAGLRRSSVTSFTERLQIDDENASEGLAPLPEYLTRGRERPLVLHVAEEAAFIAREAISNARRHSGASRIAVTVDYASGEFVVSIVDDGIGIDEEVQDLGFREGHFGLPGMRERTARIGGALRIRSSRSGTEIVLRVPASLAFVPEARRRSAAEIFRIPVGRMTRHQTD